MVIARSSNIDGEVVVGDHINTGTESFLSRVMMRMSVVGVGRGHPSSLCAVGGRQRSYARKPVAIPSPRRRTVGATLDVVHFTRRDDMEVDPNSALVSS